MKVSVILPTLNEEKYLAQCLESITNMDYDGSYEIIIGDGGSKDKTEKIADDYGARFVVEPKPTIAAGRQKACEAAKGRIIASTDADAIVTRNWLNRVTHSIDKGRVGVYGLVIPYDGSWIERNVSALVMFNYMGLMMAVQNHVPAGSNMAFKRKEFKEIKGFNTDLVTGEDVDLAKRLKKQGKVWYNPRAMVYVSMRRMQDWGYTKYVKFHLKNAVKLHKGEKGMEDYAPVR